MIDFKSCPGNLCCIREDDSNAPLAPLLLHVFEPQPAAVCERIVTVATTHSVQWFQKHAVQKNYKVIDYVDAHSNMAGWMPDNPNPSLTNLSEFIKTVQKTVDKNSLLLLDDVSPILWRFDVNKIISMLQILRQHSRLLIFGFRTCGFDPTVIAKILHLVHMVVISMPPVLLPEANGCFAVISRSSKTGRVARRIHHWKLKDRTAQTFELEELMEAKGQGFVSKIKDEDLSSLSTIKMSLSKIEKSARDAVVLPYQTHLLPSQKQQQQQQQQEAEFEDGFVSEDDEGEEDEEEEEEDPDDDLDI